MAEKSNAKLYDPSILIAMGINPVTGLPYKASTGGAKKVDLKEELRKSFRTQDGSIASRRYVWKGLPNGIKSEDVERMLYYKGQLMLFHMPADDRYYLLPYALDGTIDVYGRYTGVTPLPFTGTAEVDKKAWITGLIRTPIYDSEDPEREQDIDKICVLLYDRSKQYSQTLLSRQSLMEPILDTMAEVYPIARTSMIANSGVKGMRVSTEDESVNVFQANDAIYNASLTGEAFVPVVGAQEFQDLTSGGKLAADQFLLYLQSLDNLRFSMYGLDCGGLYEKKAQMLESEKSGNSNNTTLIYEDGLKCREDFAEVANAIFGLNISCEKPECLDQEMEEAKEGFEEETEPMFESSGEEE